MYLTGFADEAAPDIDGQIQAIKELGWQNLEARFIVGTNLTLIPDDKFNTVCEKLEAAGIKINCFGSGIANWAKKIMEPPDSSYDEFKKAIPRMHRLGTKLIRVMSFAVPNPIPLSDREWAQETFKRMKVIAKMAEDGGVLCVHENCSGWAGQSYEHTLRLLQEVPSPALKLVFDTGNPGCELDVRGDPPYKNQDSLEFYNKVKVHVVYVHIKDTRIVDGKTQHPYPGEGDSHVREILADLCKGGYDGGISIEPHMAVLAHDKSVKPDPEKQFKIYVEYGRRMEKLVKQAGWKNIS